MLLYKHFLHTMWDITITGLFNLFFCIILVKLIPNIGAAISMIISELLLLFSILRKINKIRKDVSYSTKL